MKILLLGKNGQVGWELQRALTPLGDLTALGSNRDSVHSGDFTDPESVQATIRALQPQVIVNAAAYTAVDKAESDEDRARVINATTPGLIAREAEALGAWLVHYSTDYVFDGTGTSPWTEDAATGPLGVYGRTKLEGEELIRSSGCQHLIFRTSWVYGARGGNFAKTMLRLAQERDRLQVINDQVGAPTGADLLADVTAHALRVAVQRKELAGTYHAVAAGETSWHGYAQHVIEFARAAGESVKVTATEIAAVPTTAFPTPAKRPSNSRMSTSKLQSAFGLQLPPWQWGVDRMLNEVLTTDTRKP